MMRRSFSTRKNVRNEISAAIDDKLALPDWTDLSKDDRQRLAEQLGENDTLLDLLVLRETVYEISKELDSEEPAESIIGQECFRAAEWIDVTFRLFIAHRTVEILDLDVTSEDVFTAGS